MAQEPERYMTAVEVLELELIVRDFLLVLNEGNDVDLHAFLAEDVSYRPSAYHRVQGRGAVMEMIHEIRSSFAEWRTRLVNIAVSGPVVLAELEIVLALPQKEPQCVMSFASFRVEDMRIAAWHQLHA